MPRKHSPPSYRLHKARNCAVVTIGGKNHYLGPYGSPASYSKYASLIAVSNGNGEHQPINDKDSTDTSCLSINELILAYWQFAEPYYTKNGEPSGELDNIRLALIPLRELYGHSRADQFGPKALKFVRQAMIDSDLSRGVINQRVDKIRRMFKWAVSEELAPPSLYHALQAVSGLRRGRTKARETKPVKPVPDLHVALVLPFVSPQVADMIKIQRLTGMRSSELTAMRPCDIDTTGDVWVYQPEEHKTRHHEHDKRVPLGPIVQGVLAPYLDRPADKYLFSPQEAEAWRHQHRPPYHGRQRKTKVYPCEARRRAKAKQTCRRRKPKRPKGERYDTDSYRRAIEYGIKKAAKAGVIIPHWHPHQLRHSRGTELRKLHGIEAAQVTLGHAKADVTQIYAERDQELAERIARRTG